MNQQIHDDIRTALVALGPLIMSIEEVVEKEHGIEVFVVPLSPLVAEDLDEVLEVVAYSHDLSYDRFQDYEGDGVFSCVLEF